MSIKDLPVTASSVGFASQELFKLVQANPNTKYRLNCIQWRDKRSLSQNSMFHAHMGELSQYLIGKGKTDCTPEWCKEMVKYKFLGTYRTEITDIVTGKKGFITQIRHSSKLETGEMTDFITQYIAWAVDIGCYLSLPQDSEYMKLIQEQNS